MMTRILYTGLFLIGVLLGAFPVSAADQQPSDSFTNKPTCSGSLQALIDLAAPGSILLLDDNCIYREHVTIDKPLVLDGQGVAEIRGSDVWGGWTQGDGVWISSLAVPEFESKGTCKADFGERCLWPEQVFVNGEALQQVAIGSAPGPGEFSLDLQRRVVIADDPRGAVVEVTVRKRWIDLDGDYVTVRGMTMTHSAVGAQAGGLEIDRASNWVVEGNRLSGAHGANLYFRDAPNGQLLNNELFNGGQLGFGGYSDGVLIRGNTVYNNNTEAFSPDWEAGGVKITESNGVVIDSNTFHHNLATAIWCDIDCTDITISNNNVHHNYGAGIFFEISDGADIFGNRVWENTWGEEDRVWAWESGILIASSRNARVHDNIVAWNGDGIVVFSQCRAFLDDGETCDLDHRWNSVYGNEVFDNVIVMSGRVEHDRSIFALGWITILEDAPGDLFRYMFSEDAGNRGYGNAYWIPQPEGSSEVRFAWDDHKFTELSAFNATPGEDGASYLADAERDEILIDAGIPIEPHVASE